MAGPRENTTDVLGLRVHYLEWGEPEGEPLILVHGFLDQALSWAPLVDQLSKRAQRSLRIIAPDCRGHGDSGWVGAGGYYHFPDYVYDLDCVIQTLGLTRFNLAGHSMGGTISFLYAGTFPERIVKLALIEGIGPPAMSFSDAPVLMEKWIGELRDRGRAHFREYAHPEDGARQLQHTNPRLNPELALSLACSGMRQNGNGKWVWKFDPLHRTTSPQPFYAFQAIEFLRRINCPVLVVEGTQSHQSRRSDKQARVEALRDSRLAQVENAGHMVHHDNPERLAELLADFFF